MIVYVHISFNEGKARYGFVRDLLGKAGCGEEGLAGPEQFLCGLFSRAFMESDPKLDSLRATLCDAGIRWLERREAVYTDAELRGFPFLVLTVDRKPIESGGVEYGTKYDLSGACPSCGTGAVQTSPLMLALLGLPPKALLSATCLGQILVASELAEVMKAAKLSGVELRQTRFYRNDEPLPWFQVISQHEMPKMGPATRGIVRDTSPGWGCPVCQRDMHCDMAEEPTAIAYDGCEVDPDKLPDFVHTWECFGRSVIKNDPERNLVQGFAQPRILVKPRVLDLFRKHKVRGARFQPVRVV
jgi:hypothetical protein